MHKINKLMGMIKVCILSCAVLLAMPVFSLPQSEMNLVGEAQLKYLVWNVYKAKIYSLKENFSYEEGDSFVLEILYQKNITKNIFLSETFKQWQAQGIDEQEKVEQWLAQLDAILKDVTKGDSISLYVDEHYKSYFYLNDVSLGYVDDPDFSRHFSAIWLSRNTTIPKFREELLRNVL